jgi:DNA topoisomerase-1
LRSSRHISSRQREASGREFTAKDFRTWAGTVLAARALRKCEKFSSHAQARKNIVTAVEDVACRLGNTPAICRKSYVHPAVLDSYQAGSLLRLLKHQGGQNKNRAVSGLSADERAVLGLLQQPLGRETNGTSLREPLVASVRSERNKRRGQIPRKPKASVRT